MLIYHRNPTEESFYMWINRSPESFHQCEMERFYVFIKCVKYYHAKRWEDYAFFKSKIKKANPNFSEENIALFYEKLTEGLKILRINALYSPSFYSSGPDSVIERRVKNGKIVETKINNSIVLEN